MAEKRIDKSPVGGGISSEPLVKVPGGFVSKPSEQVNEINAREETGGVKDKVKKKFPSWIVIVILVLLFGGLVGLIFLNPLVEKDEREMGLEVSEQEILNQVQDDESTPETTTRQEGGSKGGLEGREGSYVSEELGFAVKYSDERQVMEDKNSRAGNRVVFWLSSGLNFVVHAGTNWSYDNPERVKEVYTSSIAGVDAYEFAGDANQKIVDFEKDGMKYTIQCVHQRNEIVLKECGDFLNSFRFLE